jgi:DNA-binding transcriptional LysR family regulator
MELRHLRYFVTVATELHYARAARRLFISQPGLSQQIRSLEGELGLKLFERNRRGVRLTWQGAAFLSEAAAVVQQADRALEVARALAEAATGQLRLSYARTMFTGLPELIVSEYQRRFPGVEITADSGTTGSNVDRLRSGEVDIAFVLTPLEDAGDLRWVDVSREPIVVALPSGHPLSRHRRIRRDQVAGLPLVYFPRHQSPGYYDRCVAQVYGSAEPNIVRTEPADERMLVAVAEGTGITLVLAARAATLRHPGVVYRRFRDPEPTGSLGIGFRPNPSLAARRFVDLAQELAQQPKAASRPPGRPRQS